MRIGSPSVELALVAANITVAACICVVHVTRDSTPRASAHDPTSQPQQSVLVVVAAGSSTDVAVGRSAAEALGGELLLVPETGLTADMRTALARGRIGRVLVLGGPAAVSTRTESTLSQYADEGVTRLYGEDRYETAAAVASQLSPPVQRVRVMDGAGHARRETRSPRGAAAPLLFVRGDRLPAATAAALQRLRPRTIEVVTGRPLSETVLEQLQEHTPGRVVVVEDPADR